MAQGLGFVWRSLRFIIADLLVLYFYVSVVIFPIRFLKENVSKRCHFPYMISKGKNSPAARSISVAFSILPQNPGLVKILRPKGFLHFTTIFAENPV